MAQSNDSTKSKRYLKRERPQTRGYSQAVITTGGTTIWLAGQTAAEDASGKSLAGDFDGQAHEIFRRLTSTLTEAGGMLADIVNMTVFVTDVRYCDAFTKIRRGIFGDNFPASALITVTALGRPEMLLEIQAQAVV
jgi:enamine deaminase RidA (YjgF/YER057c/UK114 family)